MPRYPSVIFPARVSQTIIQVVTRKAPSITAAAFDIFPSSPSSRSSRFSLLPSSPSRRTSDRAMSRPTSTSTSRAISFVFMDASRLQVQGIARDQPFHDPVVDANVTPVYGLGQRNELVGVGEAVEVPLFPVPASRPT